MINFVINSESCLGFCMNSLQHFGKMKRKNVVKTCLDRIRFNKQTIVNFENNDNDLIILNSNICRCRKARMLYLKHVLMFPMWCDNENWFDANYRNEDDGYYVLYAQQNG